MPLVTEAISELPDTLVLGAGGSLGETWMPGLLSRLESDGRTRPPLRPGAAFAGRVGVAAAPRRSGRRVLFGVPGAPDASVRDAVLASCAVPWLFAPVEIGGREYVDGGVWSLTNLDAAP